jgi:carboxyl-terminal processing protease
MNNGIKILIGLIAAIFILAICMVVVAASFFVARGATRSGTPPVVEERAEQVEEATPLQEATVPLEMPVEPTALPAPTAVPEPDEGPAEAQTQPTTEAPAPAAQGTRPGANGEFTEEDLALLWEAWQLIAEEFDGELPSDEELTYAVIRGLVSGLDDPHTRFLDPESAQRTQERLEGSYEGIGAYVQENDQGFTEILRPIEGSPAEAAGLRPGDVVVAVDGESMAGRSLEEVISFILGPAGTEVTITFARDDEPEPFEVAITRAQITIPMVTSEMLEGNVGYVELVSFGTTAELDLSAAIQALLAQGAESLILDVRNNGGGLLTQSIAVADLFLPESVILYERNAAGEINEVFEADSGDLAEDIPLVVLVNEYSASASEIVAGAIRDHGRGVLIGETTFGKGSVQLPYTLSDGSQLNVTIAHWYTPQNVNIDEQGIAPDIEVVADEALLIDNPDEDPQLQRALDYLTNGE